MRGDGAGDSVRPVRRSRGARVSRGRGRRARRGTGRASATPRSASISSTSTTARASTRCKLPSGLGGEAAGVVVATGAGRDGTCSRRRPRRVHGERHARRVRQERVVDARWLVRLPRCHRRSHGRGDDAQGAHGLVPAQAQLRGRARRLDLAVRRRRRRRLDRGAVGEAPRRTRDRHRGQRRQSASWRSRTVASTCYSQDDDIPRACASSRAERGVPVGLRFGRHETRSCSRSIACERTG